jgi:hypothetical protein
VADYTPGMTPPPPPPPGVPYAAAPAKSGSSLWKVLGCGCLILILLGGGGCLAMGWWGMKYGLKQMLVEMKPRTLELARAQTPDQAAPLEAAFDRVIAKAESGAYGFMQNFGVMNAMNVYVNTPTMDKALTEEEAKKMVEILNDVVDHPEKYEQMGR